MPYQPDIPGFGPDRRGRLDCRCADLQFFLESDRGFRRPL